MRTVPYPSIRLLRESGHDVEAVVDDAPRTLDPEVLARAVKEERILITRTATLASLCYTSCMTRLRR